MYIEWLKNPEIKRDTTAEAPDIREPKEILKIKDKEEQKEKEQKEIA